MPAASAVGSLTPTSAHFTLHVSFAVGLFERLALIVHFLTLAQTQQQLRPALFEIDFQRYQSQAVFMRLIREPFNLLPVHQQLALSPRFMVHAVGLEVFLDVAAHQPDFASQYPSVRFLDRDVAIPQTLDLAAVQNDSALERINYFILVPSLAIFRDGLFVRIVLWILLFFALLRHSHSMTSRDCFWKSCMFLGEVYAAIKLINNLSVFSRTLFQLSE